MYREEAISNPPNHCSASLFFETHPPSHKNRIYKKKEKERIKTIAKKRVKV
jgi:hypothetical protein